MGGFAFKIVDTNSLHVERGDRKKGLTKIELCAILE
jgi:hypothetical protein